MPERADEQGSPLRPDRRSQARGTPYSGDPEGGAGVQKPPLEKLALDEWHRAQGARMVPFAGYEMPVQYEGIMAEHLWTRENAGLFDVSHMGQLLIHGHHVDAALETLLPGELKLLGDMRLRYSLLLAEDGGIIDDLMATRRGDEFYVVVNGATKHDDIDILKHRLPKDAVVDHMRGQSLLALQGRRPPRSWNRWCRRAGARFHQGGPFQASRSSRWISRSGYTGEDGFEISIHNIAAEQVANWLVGDERVKPVGLGARDSLRLEAGLPLYGHDLDRSTTPVMAGLGFAIGKRRRAERGLLRRRAHLRRSRMARPRSASVSTWTVAARP